jgi:hypothetical protein
MLTVVKNSIGIITHVVAKIQRAKGPLGDSPWATCLNSNEFLGKKSLDLINSQSQLSGAEVSVMHGR